jgi:tripartite-type tricarboxylate transporter receptor subunit TctC
MTIRRRQLLQQVGASIAFPGISRLAYALDYPIRSVRVIVPFVAGGATDIAGRLISQWLSERLHQPFAVGNRPGGGTNIGTEVAVNSPPDGYTLLLTSTSGAVNATLYQKLNFNLIRDLTPGCRPFPRAARDAGKPDISGKQRSGIYRLRES